MLTVHTYVEVADLERGITFYRDALGLTEATAETKLG